MPASTNDHTESCAMLLYRLSLKSIIDLYIWKCSSLKICPKILITRSRIRTYVLTIQSRTLYRNELSGQHVTSYKIHVTSHKIHVTSHKIHVTSQKIHVKSYKIHVTKYMSQDTCHILQDTCHILQDTCHILHVTKYMSQDTCHISKIHVKSYKIHVTSYRIHVTSYKIHVTNLHAASSKTYM